MCWSELDLETGTWTIPAARMKAGREHVVPLSHQATSLFHRMKAHRRPHNDLVFPGTKAGRPLSDMTLSKVLRDMDVNAVPHGFRSTFRVWMAEETDWPSDIAEAALAHVISDKTVAAYQRGTLLSKRRIAMTEWANFCDSSTPTNLSTGNTQPR